MKRFLKLFAHFSLVLLLLFAFTSCNDEAANEGEKEVNNPVQTESTNQEQNKAEENEENEKEEEQQKEEPEFSHVNPLTGLGCDEEIATSRPVAIMINNIHKSLPQMGIAQADIIYECLAEGAITRLMAVFSDYKNLPETGSVRSSRDYFIDLAQAHDAIYAHCGGSTYAYEVLKERNIDNLDGTNDYLPNTFWKNPDRLKIMAYEHCSMTSGEGLLAGIEQKKYRTSLADGFSHPLKFYDEPCDILGTDCQSFDIEYSYYAQSYFDYDVEKEVYLKGQFDGPHVDGYTNEALKFKNVIMLFSPYNLIAGDEYGRLEMTLTGRGEGYYITNGQKKDIIWEKKDRVSPYTLYEADGETLLYINPGKSYIGIASSKNDVKFENN